jgi:c-di-GMP-binding flagellar brake protein YcgR
MSFQDRIERRQYQRNVSLNIIQFCLVNDPPSEISSGATVNISNTGMCLLTSNNLKESESIIIQNDVLLPSQKATVRWVKNYTQNLFKAGLMFIE